MHILVTGAAGFIGSHVSERLVARGHRVTALDSFDDYLYDAETKRRTAAQLRGVSVIEADVTDANAIASAINVDVDVVCHLAALAGVRPSLADPRRYVRTNVEGTTLIAERMRALGLQRLVFASSSSVYGAKPGADPRSIAAFREDDPCLTPASPYAATKRMGELLLSTYRDLFGLGVSALRFFTVYGPRQRPDMAIAKFVDAIRHDRTISLFGDGSTRRDYTFVDDIVSGTVAAVERVQPEQYELYNLGGTKTVALSELVETIEHVMGKRARIERLPAQPGDVPVTYANIERARSDLAYEPATLLDAGIERYWAWIQGRPMP